MPSFENLPAERPPQQAEAELINDNKLPEYEPLPDLTPDQAKELFDNYRAINAIQDADEILRAMPDDLHGKKEAIRELLGAAASLMRAYEGEDPSSMSSKTFGLAGLKHLRDSLRGFGFKADEQQEMINRVYGS
jgi:hypothetical protein